MLDSVRAVEGIPVRKHGVSKVKIFNPRVGRQKLNGSRLLPPLSGLQRKTRTRQGELHKELE